MKTLRLAMVILLSFVACGGPQHKEIVPEYVAATCLTPHPLTQVSPPPRAWNDTVSLRDGSTVLITGADFLGGRIVHATRSSKQYVAANAGDYIYPADIRLDQNTDMLYVKMAGVSPSPFDGGPQTWLYKYDLAKLSSVGRVRIEDESLPEECPQKD